MALFTEEKALIGEMEGNDHKVLERRLEIVQNKQVIK